jgi:hypothetical protein
LTGEPKTGGNGIEAELDIQYMMGVALGIKTEFYEQMNMSFCFDLKAWTTLLLSTDDIPLVHSISYGWQGNLTQIGCADADVAVIDDDYKKLAAKGITIIFASGDSGSGYSPPEPPKPLPCPPSQGANNTAWTGKIRQNLSFSVPPADKGQVASICCKVAGQTKSVGWSVMGGEAWDAARGLLHAPPKELKMKCLLYSSIDGPVPAPGVTSGKPMPLPPAPPMSTKTTPLYPSWPASSPWVTAVGATRFQGDVVGAPEAAVSREDHFGSGGGFSCQFTVRLPRPASLF